MAQPYLLKVLKPTASCFTMNDLRYTMYHQIKALDLQVLPLTSAAMHQRILRAQYATYMQSHCLKDN